MDKITENVPVPTRSRLGEYISSKNSHRIYQVTPNKETLIINIIQYNYINYEYNTLLQSP
jgi:hypothetical protein